EVEVETSQPLFLDAYTTSRATGSFILIDPFSNATVGAGMVRETFVADTTSLEERNPATRVAAPGDLTAQERHLRHGHKPGFCCSATACRWQRRSSGHCFKAVS